MALHLHHANKWNALSNVWLTDLRVNLYAGVVELADTQHSKCCVVRRARAELATGTTETMLTCTFKRTPQIGSNVHFAPMDKLAKLSAFHAGDRGSNPLGSTIWLCGRTGRVAALSRRSLWDRTPPESPDSNNWFCQNIEALILNSPLRGTTTVITITNMLFLGQPRG